MHECNLTCSSSYYRTYGGVCVIAHSCIDLCIDMSVDISTKLCPGHNGDAAWRTSPLLLKTKTKNSFSSMAIAIFIWAITVYATQHRRVLPSADVSFFGHNYISHDYIRHDYIGRSYWLAR